MTSDDSVGRAGRTVGVEEELLLFAGDGVPAPAGEQLAGDPRADVEHELQLQQAEIATDPQRDLAALASDLLERRRGVARAAAARGLRVAALGTCPVPVTPTTTPDERHQRLTERFGAVAGEQLACGAHVHVGVASRAEGIAVLDTIRPWLSVLTALCANSPFHQGEDTGHAGYRTVAWGRFPTAGPTDAFGDEATYDAVVAGVVAAGAALDVGGVYFDARLSATYPTVEIRVADVGLRAGDDVLLAGLCRALVDAAACGELPEARPRLALLRAAAWRAARYGLEGGLLDVVGGRVRPADELVDDLVALLTPALRRAGDLDAVGDGLAVRLRDGSGSAQQRAAGTPSAAVALAVDCFLDAPPVAG